MEKLCAGADDCHEMPAKSVPLPLLFGLDVGILAEYYESTGNWRVNKIQGKYMLEK